MWIFTFLAVVGITLGAIFSQFSAPNVGPEAVVAKEIVQTFAIAADKYVEETSVPTGVVSWSMIKAHHASKGRGGFMVFTPPSNWHINGDGTKWAVCMPMTPEQSAMVRSQLGEGVEWDRSVYNTHSSLCP
jgi:hypothetical protein